MKMKAALYPVMIAVLALLIGTACNKSAATRNDAQVASDVQSKIFSDPNVQSRQISVQSANGVVTLSGNVNSDAERTAAAADAAAIDGVKTVVNNLTTQAAQAQPPAEEPQSQEQPATETRPAKKSAMREHRSSARNERSYSDDSRSANNSSGSMPATTTPGNAVAEAAPPPPPPPPQPKKITVPSGTQLSIRLVDALDSEKNQVGDPFRATLSAPVVIDDEVVIPQDADVQGRVVDVKSAGRYAGAASLALELTSLSFNGKTYNLSTNQWSRESKGRGKSTAGKVGAGAAIGAIIGGIAGGGKGAAIGTIAGAGAGGGAATIGHGQQIHLGSEALLSFNLQNSLIVTTQPGGNQNNRRSMDQ